MLRFLADENFDGRIITGLIQREPTLDLVRVQDAGLSGADDPTILVWAAGEERLLLTHDRKTVPGFATQRVQRGERMPGVVVIATTGSLQVAIDAILLLNGASLPGEWEGQVLTVP
jgi:predicted nuclease of predicted toxin-antitoxin system